MLGIAQAHPLDQIVQPALQLRDLVLPGTIGRGLVDMGRQPAHFVEAVAEMRGHLHGTITRRSALDRGLRSQIRCAAVSSVQGDSPPASAGSCTGPFSRGPEGLPTSECAALPVESGS